MTQNETIFAPSSGQGKSGIAVIRISGPATKNILHAMAGRVPEPRRLSLRELRSPGSDEALDQGLVVWLPAPNSYTGEDMAELHVHGGLAVVSAVLDTLAGLPDCRIAEPGEFTRQALLNGKMDLVEAEALGDLINSETDGQRRLALRQMSGELGRVYEGWRGELMRALAEIEAVLDFPDDEDAPDMAGGETLEVISRVGHEIALHLDDNRRGERLRSGLKFVLAGAPNAGKSSLLNRLADRDAAIVSTLPGTTRDAVEIQLDFKGIPVSVVDTAGIRESEDEIEQEGVSRAKTQAGDADLVIWLLDPEQQLEYQLEELSKIDSDPVLVFNKSDLGKRPEAALSGTPLELSAKTGAGVDGLVDLLESHAVNLAGIGKHPTLTRARHRQALQACARHLARIASKQGLTEELKAEELRLGVRALGRITGRVDVEDMLDILFMDYCIGK